MLKMESKDNMELPFISDAAFKGNCCLEKKKIQIHYGGGGLDRGEWLRYDDGWDNKPFIPPPPPPTRQQPISLPPPNYQMMVIKCDF